MTELKKHVETLIANSAEAKDSGDAMRLAQAALNAANAMCALSTALALNKGRASAGLGLAPRPAPSPEGSPKMDEIGKLTLRGRGEELLNKLLREEPYTCMVGAHGDEAVYGESDVPFKAAVWIEEVLDLLRRIEPLAERAASIPETVPDARHAHTFDDYPAGAWRAVALLASDQAQ